MAKKKKSMRVIKENGKLRQVTHWDIDYLSADQIETLYAKNDSEPSRNVANSTDLSGTKWGLLLIGVGSIVLLFSLFLASRL